MAHPDLDFHFTLDWPDIAHPSPVTDADARLFSLEGVYRSWEVFTEEDGLGANMVFGVNVRGDEVWFSTDGGVSRLKDGKFRTWTVKDGLPHDATTQVAFHEPSGEVWLSTLGGVACFDGTKWTAYTQESTGKDGLINNCAFGIGVLGDDVWIATFDGIGRYDRAAKKWYQYYLHNAPLDEVWTYGLECNPHFVNFAVWGGGLVQYFPDEDKWEAHHDPDGSFEMELFQNDGMISQMATATSYANGRSWATSYFGAAVFDGRDWQEWDMDTSGLRSNFIQGIRARRNEGYLCGNDGVLCMDLARDRWVDYRKLDGPGGYGEITIKSRDGRKHRTFMTRTSIPFNFVWAADFQGEDIWVGTSHGVARGRYTPEEEVFKPDPTLVSAGGTTMYSAPRPVEGFSVDVLEPRYVQPYHNFTKPKSVPLDRPYADFVDPISRLDRSFENDTEVRIGFLGCLSGPAKSYSEEMLKGSMMAVEEINSAGGYHGKPVVLKIRDDEALMGKDANEMVKLIFTDRVLAVLGSMSSDTTHVALRLALKCEVPEITSISTDPTITQIVVPWIFRCLADDWSQSRALAKYVFGERKFTRVALLEHNNRYGRMGSAELKRVAKRMERPIRVAIKYPSNCTDDDIRGYLKIIRDHGADAIVNWGLYPQGARIVKMMKEVGLDIPFFGADGLVAQQFITDAGEAAEGVVVTYPYDYYRESPLTQDFNRRFEAKHGYPPDSFAAHGYDAMMIVWRGVKIGGLSRARIRDAMATTRDFHGVTGMISFDHRNNDMRGVDFAVVHEGRFLPLRMAGEFVRKGAHEK
jgi:ABC-type branched-subunit amino acid transport system substrate-binding protein